MPAGWEYCEVNFADGWELHYQSGTRRQGSLSELQATIARLGVEGWEMVAVVWKPKGEDMVYYFKRPL